MQAVLLEPIFGWTAHGNVAQRKSFASWKGVVARNVLDPGSNPGVPIPAP